MWWSVRNIVSQENGRSSPVYGGGVTEGDGGGARPMLKYLNTLRFGSRFS